MDPGRPAGRGPPKPTKPTKLEGKLTKVKRWITKPTKLNENCYFLIFLLILLGFVGFVVRVSAFVGFPLSFVGFVGFPIPWPIAYTEK